MFRVRVNCSPNPDTDKVIPVHVNMNVLQLKDLLVERLGRRQGHQQSKLWVGWNDTTYSDMYRPGLTELTEGDATDILALLQQRPGKDVIWIVFR